ncbi:MAG: Asp-tRNA(Asn)/Glu-tRNA(Gln) amidotransferase subunit GatB [Anaerolineae bacterium]
MNEYEAIIGMEVHAQLRTQSKMFCGCDAEAFGAEPNTHVCPVCLALPGALPVANRRAVELTMMVGLALNCTVAGRAVFSRKNYFYPDLPKGYQISMYDFPLCQNGWLEVKNEFLETRRIRIRRVHLEEDTAKLFHAGDHSLVDFNRAGLPLIEIVTEPDLRTAAEAEQYLVQLRSILRYLGASTADMEKGAMRCEVNVSVRPAGQEALGTKVEIKNLNSFRAVKQALAYEIRRQTAALEAGQPLRQVTMGWAEGTGRTVEQRSKETAEDYRYFPEPDLPPLEISAAWVEEVRGRLPELPRARRARLVEAHGLAPALAETLTEDREVADYYEAAAAAGDGRGVPAPTMANWIVGDVFRLLKARDVEIGDVPVSPEDLAELVALVEKDTITARNGKAVLEEMVTTGRPPGEIVRERGLTKITDEEVLATLVDEILAHHPEEVAAYRAGKETLLQWFVGQVMRLTRGKADPQVTLLLLRERLG